MPFWIFAAGRLYIDDSVQIPYTNLVSGLSLVAVPCLLGVLLKNKKPKYADGFARGIKYLAVVFLLWVIILGSVTNSYIFSVMIQEWYTLPAGLLLPYLGALLGCMVSAVLCQTRERVIAISVETGVQDTGVAILLLLTSFGRPEGQIASAVPIAAAIFTPLPFTVVALIKVIYERCWRGGRCVRCGGPDERPPVPEEIDQATFSAIKSDTPATDSASATSHKLLARSPVNNNDKL